MNSYLTETELPGVFASCAAAGMSMYFTPLGPMPETSIIREETALPFTRIVSFASKRSIPLKNCLLKILTRRLPSTVFTPTGWYTCLISQYAGSSERSERMQPFITNCPSVGLSPKSPP